MALEVRVDALIKLGLDKYGEGDLVGALSEWEHALTLEPDAALAAQYIDYVRTNFDLLEEQFREARAAAAAAEAEGVPFGAEITLGGAELDDDAYEAFEIEDQSDGSLTAWIESAALDEGWVLDDVGPAEPLPPAPAHPEDALGVGLDLVGEGMVGVEGGEIGDGAAELALDADLHRVATPAAAAPASPQEAGAGEAAPGALDLDLPGEDEADFGDLNSVLERSGRTAAAPARDDDDLEETVPGGEEPPPLPERPSLSDEAIAAMEVGREVARDGEVTGVPGTDVPADFDLGEVGRLDHGLRDDRIVEPEDVRDVRVTFHDVGTSEKTMPARPNPAEISLPDELELEPSDAASARSTARAASEHETEEALEETVERDSALGGWPPAFDDIAEDEQTRERASLAALLADEDRDRPPTVDPSLQIGHDELDDSGHDSGLDFEATREVRAMPDDDDDDDGELELGAAGAARAGAAAVHHEAGAERTVDVDAVRMEAIAAQIDREIDAGVPVEESADDRTRRRVGALIERAEREYRAGNHAVAVAALDLALDERPESAIAQKIVHRHRDLLFAIYEAFIGDDKACPIVALPMHEIALQELDSRAAFLLSRIDGSLSFEEVLDVAGMSRLEAYRHLCRLLLRGILEVR